MKKIPFSQISKYREHNKKKMLELFEKSPAMMSVHPFPRVLENFKKWPKGWSLYMVSGKEWYKPNAFSLLSQSLPKSGFDFLSKLFQRETKDLTPTAFALATENTAYFVFFLYDEKKKRLRATMSLYDGWATSSLTYPEEKAFKDYPPKTSLVPSFDVLKEIEKFGVPPLAQIVDVGNVVSTGVDCSSFLPQLFIKFSSEKLRDTFEKEVAMQELFYRNALVRIYKNHYGYAPKGSEYQVSKKLKKMEKEFELAECDFYHVVAEGEVPDPAWAWFKEHFIPVLL